MCVAWLRRSIDYLRISARDVRDASLFAEAIVEVLSSDSLQRQLGENARRRIPEDYTWDRIGAKTESIYKAVLAGSSATASA